MKAYHTRPLLERMASVNSPLGRHAARYVDAVEVELLPKAQIVAQPKTSAHLPVPRANLTVYSGAPQTMLKFCKDCSWHKGEAGWGFGKVQYKCASPNLLNLVTGEFSNCEENRRFNDKCGRNARYFEIRRVPEVTFLPRIVETHDTRSEPDDYALSLPNLCPNQD